MNARSAAAILAVTSAAAFTDARAQQLILRDGPELNFIKPGRSVAACPHQTVFENAVRGSPSCDALTRGRASPAFDDTRMFIDDHARADNVHTLNKTNDRPKNSDDRQKNSDKSPNDDGERSRGGQPDLDDPIPVTATPEPASLALVATGLVGVAAYRRRRAKEPEGINN